jgi:hypothetical protein
MNAKFERISADLAKRADRFAVFPPISATASRSLNSASENTAAWAAAEAPCQRKPTGGSEDRPVWGELPKTLDFPARSEFLVAHSYSAARTSIERSEEELRPLEVGQNVEAYAEACVVEEVVGKRC